MFTESRVEYKLLSTHVRMTLNIHVTKDEVFIRGKI